MHLARRLTNKVRWLYKAYVKQYMTRGRSLKVRCPICGWKGQQFADFDCGYGRIYPNSTCPRCRAQPRHRLCFLYLKSYLAQHVGLTVLHFAPEPFLSRLLSGSSRIGYITADIDPSKAIDQQDITQLSYSDESFDLILCLHVLEHVPNDALAMSELRRVLRKNGHAIVDVPIDFRLASTFEDATITTPEARTRAYWQFDHLRLYGNDFPDHLRNAGFEVTVVDATSLPSCHAENIYGLKETRLFVCSHAQHSVDDASLDQ